MSLDTEFEFPTLEAEIVPDDESEISEPPIETPELRPAKRGECRVCGEKAKDGRSFYCDDHVQFAPSSNRVTPLGAPSGPRAARDTAAAATRNLAKRFKKFILDHNTDIAKGGQMIAQIPEPWMDDVIATVTVQKPDGTIETVDFWKPCLREQLQVTEKQAEILANAMVQFSTSDQGGRLAKVMEGFAPYFTLIAAGAVMVQHTIKLNQIKASVQMLKSRMNEANEPQSKEPEVVLSEVDDDLNGDMVA